MLLVELFGIIVDVHYLTIYSGKVKRSSPCIESYSAGPRHSVLQAKKKANAGLPLQQEINIQNMNVELVAQMFKNYRSNVLFHLEGKCCSICLAGLLYVDESCAATDGMQEPS